LIDNVSKQAKERDAHLPEDMKQKVIIDIRGQVVSKTQKDFVEAEIIKKSNGIIKATDIEFK